MNSKVYCTNGDVVGVHIIEEDRLLKAESVVQIEGKLDRRMRMVYRDVQEP